METRPALWRVAFFFAGALCGFLATRSIVDNPAGVQSPRNLIAPLPMGNEAFQELPEPGIRRELRSAPLPESDGETTSVEPAPTCAYDLTNMRVALPGSPSYYLDAYVDSWSAGHEGGRDFFRSAVKAYARELLYRIIALIEETAIEGLREDLIAVLDTPELHGDAAARACLLRQIESSPLGAKVQALRSIGRVGDYSDLSHLGLIMGSCETFDERRLVVESIVAVAGAHANEAIGELWPNASDESTRVMMLVSLDGSHVRTALSVVRQAALTDELATRTQAAYVLQRLGGTESVALASSWLGWERDQQIRSILEQLVDSHH